MSFSLISHRYASQAQSQTFAKKRDLSRAKLLRTGAELFSQQSYASTGVDHLIKQAGLTKGTFYHYFKSKESFAVEVARQYGDYFNHKLETYLLNADGVPVDRLAAYVNDSARTLERHRFAKGCVIGNLTQELGSSSPALAVVLQDVFEGWQQRVSACLAEARDRGEITISSTTEELAVVFWLGWEGALMQARLLKKRDPMDLFFRSYRKLLQPEVVDCKK